MTYIWPHDDSTSLIEFYGRPWDDPGLLTHVVPPFSMYYEGTEIHGILIHKKCADALKEALQTCWDSFDRNQKLVNASGLSNYSGSYNYRNVRGANRLSCHSFGAALDIDAEHNPLGSSNGRMSPIVINAFKAVGAFWGGDFVHRKDPMHIQFAHE